MLETAAQPIWVVDPDGVIRFANPAAIAALGYDSADELFGRHSHETIHYQHPDGTPYPAADCPMLLPQTTGETVASDLDWFFRRDGSMFPVSYVSVPIEMPEGRGAVVAFTDIEDRLRAEQVLREHDAVLAIARGLAAADRDARRRRGGVGGGVRRDRQGGGAGAGRSAGRCLALRARWDGDRGRRLERASASVPDRQPLAARRHGDHRRRGPGDRPSREDRRPTPTSTARSPTPCREAGIRSAVGAPIVVEGRLWGVMAAGSSQEQPLPPDTEARLASFTELVATAIANAEARTELAASRARIVAATDEERRRVVRDLHDGAQQRLVHTVITLKLARRALETDGTAAPRS